MYSVWIDVAVFVVLMSTLIGMIYWEKRHEESKERD